MKDFSELSGCVFSWLEKQCQPQLLQQHMYKTLEEVRLAQEEKGDAAAANALEAAARLERDGR